MSKTINHIVYIVDGHRRYALEKNVSLLESVERSTIKIADFIEWCFSEHPIDEISIFAVATYNLETRSQNEIFAFSSAYFSGMIEIFERDFVKKSNININLIGDIDLLLNYFTPSISQMGRFNEYVNHYKNNTGKRVNILAPYDHNKELRSAIRKCEDDNVDITFENISTRWCIPPVNLVIRTAQYYGFVRSSSEFPGSSQARFIGIHDYPQEITKERVDLVIQQYLILKDSSTL